MTKVYYDTEFIDDGRTIDLISIGAITEDGREFYRISSEFDQYRAQDHPFVGPQVLPHLPGKVINGKIGEPGSVWWLDTESELVVPRRMLTFEWQAWLWEVGGGQADTDPAEIELSLWAYYASYDHVANAQLWGPMMALPAWMPKRTNDLAQRMEAYGVTSAMVEKAVPDNEAAHDALADAKWNKALDEYLDRVERAREVALIEHADPNAWSL